MRKRIINLKSLSTAFSSTQVCSAACFRTRKKLRRQLNEFSLQDISSEILRYAFHGMDTVLKIKKSHLVLHFEQFLQSAPDSGPAERHLPNPCVSACRQ